MSMILFSYHTAYHTAIILLKLFSCECVCVREKQSGKDLRHTWQMFECNLKQALLFSQATEDMGHSDKKTSDPRQLGEHGICVFFHICAYVTCVAYMRDT